MEPPHDPLLSLVILATLLASAVAWVAIAGRLVQREPLLKYEARRLVPWGAFVGMLAIVFVAVALLTPETASSDDAPKQFKPVQTSQQLAGFIVLQSVIIGAVVVAVAVVYRPTVRDFGLPEYVRELARDIGVGVVAAFAALLPVYGVQWVMLLVFGPSNHPLLEMVSGGGPHPMVVFLATVAAVVVAPIGEEILFRLLLQGWLEKWEDRRLGWRFEPVKIVGHTESSVPAMGSLNDESQNLPDSSFVIHHSSLETPKPLDEPPRRGLLGLPYGWTPILVSSLLFALAHFGYGPDPFAIFVLALILGYVYQRTHRIVPCIVAHALFNSLAIFILWRMLYLGAE